MEYTKVNLNKIIYSKNNILYNNGKLSIILPPMKTINGIEKRGETEKYQIMLEIDNPHFLNFIKEIEKKNKSHCKTDSKYKSNLFQNNETGVYYLILKIPCRYNKFEIHIRSDRVYLPISTDVKNNTVACRINITNIWNYTTDTELEMSGSIFEVKEIFIY